MTSLGAGVRLEMAVRCLMSLGGIRFGRGDGVDGWFDGDVRRSRSGSGFSKSSKVFKNVWKNQSFNVVG